MKQKQHPEIDKAWLITNWVNTDKSIKQLAEELQISDSLIESRIASYKLKKTFKHSLDTDKFFNLTDPHIWYIAGLATTDGYFPKDQDALTFELVGDDECKLLNEMKNYYHSTQAVKCYHKHDKYYHSEDGFDVWYWRIQANGLQEFFSKNFNIDLRHKTFETSAPTEFPNETCAKAYILGCLDGDGYISTDCTTVNLCTASAKFVYSVADIVEKYSGIAANKATTPRGDKRYPISIWRTNKAKQMLAWLYSLNDCFKLDRKYKKYLNINNNHIV